MLRLLIAPVAAYLVVLLAVYLRQRSLLFFPSHGTPPSRLAPWIVAGRTNGYCRVAPNASTVWLMMHGNGGQAANRDYVLECMSDQDSLYVLEYPGYGQREGIPSRESLNRAAAEAYRLLRLKAGTNVSVCVLGESLGSGPACALAAEQPPPDKIVLVVPFDVMAKVAAERYRFLPVRLLLKDAWDNVEALRHYPGRVEIYGARDDSIIPVAHAEALAKQVPNAHFTGIRGEHNEWSVNGEVKLRP